MRPIDRAFNADDPHGIVIASCGYERRSSYIGRLGLNKRRGIAATYPATGADREAENRELYESLGWDVLPSSEALDEAIASSSQAGVCLTVDISSMPRRFLADVVERITASKGPRPRRVRFLYCPGDFEQTSRAAGRDVNLSATPVSPYFEGGHRPTSVPVGLVVGLGLEPHRALGIMELLEPVRTWVFKSDAADERYRDATDAVNRQVLADFEARGVFDYDLHSLESTYFALESLTHAACSDYRLVFAPSGPKIFSLACLLVGAKRSIDRPAVWRVGGSETDAGADVDEMGKVVCADIDMTVGITDDGDSVFVGRER
jgi:hypothetical protein